MQFKIRGVHLILPNVWSSGQLPNIEVRAGMAATPAGFDGKIEVNTRCGAYEAPTEAGGEFDIMCEEPILANFITVQMLNDDSVLPIDELKILKDANSKLVLNFKTLRCCMCFIHFTVIVLYNLVLSFIYFVLLGLKCAGNASCCIPGIPCGEGEGDCDSDSDCKEGLTCGHNNCPIKSGGAWNAADDCCVKPSIGK